MLIGVQSLLAKNVIRKGLKYVEDEKHFWKVHEPRPAY